MDTDKKCVETEKKLFEVEKHSLELEKSAMENERRRDEFLREFSAKVCVQCWKTVQH